MRFLSRKENLGVFFSSSLLIVFIGYLLWANYLSQKALEKSALKELGHQIKMMANTVGYFYSERKNDLEYLAAREEIFVFFEKQASGMSMDNELQESVSAIQESFKRLLESRKVGHEPIYNRLALVERNGKLLADTQSAKSIGDKTRYWGKYLNPDSSGNVIDVEHDGRSVEVVLTLPCVFRNRYLGQVIAWISHDTVYKHFIMDQAGSSWMRFTYIDCLGLHLHDGTGNTLEPASLGLPDHDTLRGVAENGEPYRFRKLSPENEEKEMVAYIAQIQGTPFSMISVLPISEVYGFKNPWQLLLEMGALALMVLAGTASLFQIKTRNLLLQARLEESDKRERDIHQINAELQKEIMERQRVGEALEKYKEKLEEMVEARTAELEEAQNVFVNRAMEAGRAQLSAMVLHNIGNAITPVKVYTEGMKASDLERLLGYLESCYLDLSEHAPDVQRYVNDDPKGKEVFSYMGKLINFLKKHADEKAMAVNKIHGAVTYISDILTLQQSYAAKEREIKEQTDLNHLIGHALHMQGIALEKRGIVVKKDLQSDLPKVLIDKGRLMQALVNFIKNSYEAIDELEDESEQRVITLKTFADNGQVCIQITDTGVGLKPNDTGAMFEFGKSHKGSSGVGLYYCKMFIEANRGTVTITSPGKGKGTTVVVRLPSEEVDS
ncbi:MAG: HAMP domain-containing sensor histidine kinase [Desulfobacteraceae bacterium]